MTHAYSMCGKYIKEKVIIEFSFPDMAQQQHDREQVE